MSAVELSDVGVTTTQADDETLIPMAADTDDYDLTIVFPLDNKGDAKGKTFTEKDFVWSMLGLREIREKDPSFVPAGDNLFLHTASRILKTTQCFVDEHGRQRMASVVARGARHNSQPAELPHGATESDTRASFERDVDAQRAEMMEILSAEYVAEIGSREPCTPKQYQQLIARTIVRRVQLTCGLEARMFLSVDADEIICTVTADAEDLMTEADRIDYKMQTLNMPFGMAYGDAAFKRKKGTTEGDAAHEATIARVNELAIGHLGRVAFDKSKQEMRDICGGPKQQPPHMDPLLASEGKHATLHAEIEKMGHHECHGSDVGAGRVYLAPYVKFNKKDLHLRPFFRVYDVPAEAAEAGSGMFRPIDRARLVGSMVWRHLNLPSLLNQKKIVDFFAPHQEGELQWMRDHWALDFKPWTQLRQPLGRVRNYFGEKIAMYFAWLEFYTRALIIPSIVGTIIWIDTFIEGKTEGFSLIFYGGFVSLWATVFCEFWVRQNAFFNLWWGTSDLKQEEQERPAFIGKTRLSPVNDEFEVAHFAMRYYYAKLTTGAAIVFLLICGVIGAISGIFLLKNKWAKDWQPLGATDPTIGPKQAAFYAGILNAVQIQVLNIVYRKIALNLNAWENHRTDSDYENNLIAKTFLFQFVNSYASFFYIAFLKTYLGDPCLLDDAGVPDCMGELQVQLGTIFVTRLVIGNATEIGIPLLKYKLRMWQEKRSLKGSRSANAAQIEYTQPENEAKLNSYEEMESFDDYAEMVLQYGFVTLFVVAFPLAPLLAFVNNVAEIHVDAVKLCYGHRRPWPRSATSIGNWSFFLSLMSTMSVITNIALLIFTANIPDLPTSTGSKWLMFMVAEHLLLVWKKMVEDFVPDAPHFTEQLLARHKWLEQRVFFGLTVESDAHLKEKAEQLDLDADGKLAIHANPNTEAGVVANPTAGGDGDGNLSAL